MRSQEDKIDLDLSETDDTKTLELVYNLMDADSATRLTDIQ